MRRTDPERYQRVRAAMERPDFEHHDPMAGEKDRLQNAARNVPLGDDDRWKELRNKAATIHQEADEREQALQGIDDASKGLLTQNSAPYLPDEELVSSVEQSHKTYRSAQPYGAISDATAVAADKVGGDKSALGRGVKGLNQAKQVADLNWQGQLARKRYLAQQQLQSRLKRAEATGDHARVRSLTALLHRLSGL